MRSEERGDGGKMNFGIEVVEKERWKLGGYGGGKN